MSEPMSAERLDEIEEIVNAATPGPWGVFHAQKRQQLRDESPGFWVMEMAPDGAAFGLTFGDAEFSEEDADFIASARQDVPDLVAEVRRLRLENRELALKVCERMPNPYAEPVSD